jgi:hypothetical protein
MQQNEKKKETELKEFKIQNSTRDRSVFVFMKLRVADIELEGGDYSDYEMFQLRYKRIIQKAIEERTQMKLKLIIVTT